MKLALIAIFAATTAANAPHGQSVTGHVIAVQQTAHTVALKDAAGHTTSLVWNAATQLSGPKLAIGENATARYMVRDGKNVATSIVTTPHAVAAKPAPAKPVVVKTTPAKVTTTTTAKTGAAASKSTVAASKTTVATTTSKH
ncbi:MAG: hypothetical protein JO197_19650 [Acidobacteria bacterium]|nr:hypothetical protein [Acidobacteriota bacterium]MBV9478574.1 hypothetical protein [Acidobacteriota bacterium]